MGINMASPFAKGTADLIESEEIPRRQDIVGKVDEIIVKIIKKIIVPCTLTEHIESRENIDSRI